MKTVHKVCSMLRKDTACERNMSAKKIKEFVRCKECPAYVDTPYGKGKNGCRMHAEEYLNIVKFGNPWGRKYRNSRKSWPDRSGFTDEHSRKRRVKNAATAGK